MDLDTVLLNSEDPMFSERFLWAHRAGAKVGAWAQDFPWADNWDV